MTGETINCMWGVRIVSRTRDYATVVHCSVEHIIALATLILLAEAHVLWVLVTSPSLDHPLFVNHIGSQPRRITPVHPTLTL